jgi:hypothetical protein
LNQLSSLVTQATNAYYELYYDNNRSSFGDDKEHVNDSDIRFALHTIMRNERCYFSSVNSPPDILNDVHLRRVQRTLKHALAATNLFRSFTPI